MKIYLICIVLGLLFGSTGVRVLKHPVTFTTKNKTGTFYESKKACINQELWDLSQKWYGQHMLICCGLYMLSSLAIKPGYEYFVANLWSRESNAVPFFLFTVLPLMILIGFAYGTVELRLKEYMKKNHIENPNEKEKKEKKEKNEKSDN